MTGGDSPNPHSNTSPAASDPGPDAALPTPTDCTKCAELCENRTQIVNGTGPEDASILIVGEAPGASEDARGKPFVGQSGDVLTKALLRNGINRRDIRITNTVRCKPPGNRDPTEEERENCFAYLRDEITVVDPVVIVPVGKVPTETLLGMSVSVTEVAGTCITREFAGCERTVMPCLHPAATLYDPGTKPVFDETLRKLATITGHTPQSQTSLDDY